MFKNRATRYWFITGCLFFLFGGTLTAVSVLYGRSTIRKHWESECRALAARYAVTLREVVDRPEESRGPVLEERLAGLVQGPRLHLGVVCARVTDPAGRILAEAGQRAGEQALLAATSAIPSTTGELTLVALFDPEVLSPEIAEATWLLIGLFSGLALVGFLVARWMLGKWMAPIHELSEKMTKVREGDLTAVAEEVEDEVGELAHHFNNMVEGIRTARRQSMELARKQANIEKFAALGRLSAGVAHEINNPVGGILTCLETMKSQPPGSARYREYLNLIRAGLERIGKIVGQLLRFSHQGAEGERKLLDLNTVIEEVVLLSRFHNRDDRVKVVRRHQHVPPVRGAPDLLHQLLLNLVLNALQEMPDGGTLTLSTRVEETEVCISVEDTGPGIPEELLDRIFEPFVTTKEIGVGTGLGLSVALGIVESHGGTIEARNRAIGGAQFTIRLPIAGVGEEAPAPVMETSI